MAFHEAPAASSHGVKQRNRERMVELAPKLVDVSAERIDVEVAPDQLAKLRARDDTISMAHEMFQELSYRGAQSKGAAGSRRRQGGRAVLEVREPERDAGHPA
jgi:hypothetical protein